MVFNLQGSEVIIILLLALVVLGPEKLPDAVRKFNQTYGDLKKMGTGFHSELKNAIDEPMREMRETTDRLRDAADPSKVGDRTPAESLPLTIAPVESGTDTPQDPSSAVGAGNEIVDGPAENDVAETPDPSDPGSDTIATPGDPPTPVSPPSGLCEERRDDAPMSAAGDDESATA